MTPEWRRGIGMGQLIGAAVGIVGLRISTAAFPDVTATAPVIVASAFFLLALGAGLLLLWNRRLGVPLSLAVQAVQVLSITVGSESLRFLAGPFAGVWLGGAGVRLSLAGGGLASATAATGSLGWLPGAHVDIGIGYPSAYPEALTVGVNVVAALACVQLWRALGARTPTGVGGTPTAAELAPPTSAG